MQRRYTSTSCSEVLHDYVQDQSTEWRREYAHGAAFELYDVRFSAAFHRKSFSEAVELCFEKLGVLLVAVGFTPNASRGALAEADAESGSANSSRRSSVEPPQTESASAEGEEELDVGDVEEVLVNPAYPPLSIQVGTMKAFLIAENELAAKRCAL